MKISKSQLRQIIKEELSSLNENNPESAGAPTEARAALERIWNVINEYEGDPASVYERAERILPRIEELAAALEEDWRMALREQTQAVDDEGSPWRRRSLK